MFDLGAPRASHPRSAARCHPCSRRRSSGASARASLLNLAPVGPRCATIPGRSSPRTTSRRPKDGRRLRRHGDASRHRRASRRCVVVRVGDGDVARRRRDRVLNQRPPPDPRRPSHRSDRPISNPRHDAGRHVDRPPRARRHPCRPQARLPNGAGPRALVLVSDKTGMTGRPRASRPSGTRSSPPAAPPRRRRRRRGRHPRSTRSPTSPRGRRPADAHPVYRDPRQQACRIHVDAVEKHDIGYITSSPSTLPSARRSPPARLRVLRENIDTAVPPMTRGGEEPSLGTSVDSADGAPHRAPQG